MKVALLRDTIENVGPIKRINGVAGLLYRAVAELFNQIGVEFLPAAKRNKLVIKIALQVLYLIYQKSAF